jgi:quercetin dioxygenase-like cupin family protein
MSEPQVVQLEELAERASAGIVSKAVHEGPEARVVLFTFDAGQELTEHRASRAATIQVLDGTGEFTLGTEVAAVRPGSWIYLPPELPHALRATMPLTMLLTLLGTD